MKLVRYLGNPVLKPIYSWEEGGVFNAGAVYHNGLFHLLYRAVYGENRSNIGYAVSRDGFHFFRLDKPVFEHTGDFETFGAEDPRITKIDDTFYMLYTAYSEKGTRVSLASTKNFITWERYGVVLPDMDNKDAVLFPEKINNQYVMLHRIPPDIWIAYSDDLLHWKGHKIIMSPRKGYWDNEKIGAGAPPIKTEYGWLLFYHGVDKNLIYRLGIALLDLEDPSIVLKRQEEPILEPEKSYELEGIVPNVVFTCGVVEVNNLYYVYYGGGDYVIGVATVEKEIVERFIRE